MRKADQTLGTPPARKRASEHAMAAALKAARRAGLMVDRLLIQDGTVEIRFASSVESDAEPASLDLKEW
ncbi:hypothetical protein GOZ97_00250 [Agrobacterium vitis]|uniref:hypothetical protein n=1 Tax=Rhizobium/Agrobacterium group TaxID=227290 RepID=UPI0008DC1710|nr:MULTISPECIES: hypothetical protein [Rhizobium/Agrobacterium group]MCF1434047.1 hypothetical protein [Allorhizobium ampelinum]MCF1449735.1 hypothetical protein [Allorhizobium ampelinum]MUO89987.1 hypothetical protein [Agrobacterium vitis]MUZ51943.1 hypothetical protein [Agrobacterium vitis]MUZ89840.1 hypothetical protein [Agrobacterium vitis]